MTNPEKLIRGLTHLHADLCAMEEDEDYSIFDDWEIGELSSLIQRVLDHMKEEKK